MEYGGLQGHLEWIVIFDLNMYMYTPHCAEAFLLADNGSNRSSFMRATRYSVWATLQRRTAGWASCSTLFMSTVAPSTV